MMRVLSFALALVISACTAGHAQPSADALRDGDIIFQTSRSAQSVAIQRATRSPYSHMGMVLHRGGKPYVLEASATVRYTPLAAWIARGEDERYVVKRLRDANTRLTPEAIGKLKAHAAKLEGKRYDLTFEWSDERMYCSELVYKIYERALGIQVGELAALGTFNHEDPVVRAKLAERYGDQIPLDEPVISPVAMFDSPALELVESNTY